MADHFCLKWNNFQTSILTAFESLHNSEDLVDVTLMCEGRNVKAHKVILSACSPYFRNLFKEHPCQHPVIILKDVYYCDLQAILQFMYQGEVLITQDQLSSFLKTAELLQVSGLAGAMPPSVSEQPIVPEPIAASTAADTMKSELTFTKHTPEVTRKDADKKTYESKAEPLQSCSYTSSDNVLIKMESDNDDFELVDTDYGSSNHENMDESSTLGEEESILERSLKAQSDDHECKPARVKDEKSVCHKFQRMPRTYGVFRRKRCQGCYLNIRNETDSITASRRAKKVATECIKCKKPYCEQCFAQFHPVSC